MKIRVRIILADARGAYFMGAGLMRLLRRVERLGSIQLAARDMGMSYAKAHRILKRLEAGTGHKCLLRRRGGRDHGGARLTPYARRFLAKYGVLEGDIHVYARKKFAKMF